MQSNMNIPIKVTTSGYEVISSGVVHLTGTELKFNLANLVVKYIFKTDSDGTSRYSGEVIDNELIISLYNFSNSLGEGIIKPLEIGNLNGRKLFATCFIHTPDADHRQFGYTFMLKEA